MNNVKTIRFKKISLQFSTKTIKLALLLIVFLLLSMMLSVALGDRIIHPLNVINALFGKGDPDDILVVQQLRLPRIIIGVLVGISLAVSGAIMQGVIRNPLAAPDIIGVTGGASVAAVFFIIYLQQTISIHWLPLASMLGAIIASIIIYLLAWKQGVSPIRLILVGIGIASLMSGIKTLILVMTPTYSATSAFTWLTGTIYGSSWQNVWTLLPWTVVFMSLVFGIIRHLNIQQLGDDIAKSVGSSLQRQRFWLIMLSVALAGSAVSMAGVVGFVGLIAPHIARRIVGGSSGNVLPLSALIGAIMVILADLIARTAFLPHDIPVGVFTAGIGAPFFIFLLYRTRNTK
jgi:iron complex transport system permease protein